MEVVICKDANQSAERAASWVEAAAGQGVRSLYLPAGATPEALYRLWREARPAYLRNLALVQIDDVLTGAKRGLFREFLSQALPGECSRIEWIVDGARRADAAILGIGLNGHVAFHEPGLSGDFFSGCVPLAPATCERLGLAPGTWGISYGLGAFRDCRQILLMAFGETKRAIVRSLLQAEAARVAGDLRAVSTDRPVTLLLGHPRLTLLLDQAAFAVDGSDQKERPG